ncbi:MAG: site-specific DNA-methyltransferase [Bacteroidetes bacterium]|nr:site-specific DNA-methyltransferase [Bacteroidota bacterium]
MNRFNSETISEFAVNAKNTNYLTHNFHPFPAKFIPQIPNNLIKEFTNPNDIVLDPFCGSGTSLVEAKLLGRNSIGIDLHPLATFISKVKTTKIHIKELQTIKKILQNIKNNIDEYYNDAQSGNSEWKNFTLPEFSNRDHWFQKNVLFELAIIKKSVKKKTIPKDLQDLCLCAMSAIMVLVSNQNGETRYAAISKDLPPKKTFELFENKLDKYIARIMDFNKESTDCWVKLHNSDTREIDFIDDNSVDFIITSPPYANTYEYYLYHKQRMNWLDMEWEIVRDNEIGSRYKHSSRKEGIGTYLDAMEECFRHFNRILKKNKFFTIVIGDAVIQQQMFSGLDMTNKLAKDTGFKVVKKINYELDTTSKLFSQAFRQKGKKEHILLLQKTT